jgi:hypothetical protein
MSFRLAIYFGLLFLDSKHEIIFTDENCSKSPGAHVVLVNADHTVVAGEAVLLIRPNHACTLRSNVYTWLLNADLLASAEATPDRKVGKSLHWVRPLASQESARRVLEVDSEKKAILLVIVHRVDVRFHSHCLTKNLAERARIHVLGTVSILKLVSSFRVLALQQLLKVVQQYQSVGHVSIERAVLDYCCSVTFSLSSSPCWLLWHLEPVVDSGQLHLGEAAHLISALSVAVHKSEVFVLQTEQVLLIVQLLVRGVREAAIDLVFVEHMLEVSLHNSLLNGHLVIEAVQIVHKLILLRGWDPCYLAVLLVVVL